MPCTTIGTGMARPDRQALNLLVAASLTLGLLLHPLPGQAQAYKWVDEDGKVHYSQTVPPEKSEIERERLSDSGVLVEEPLYRTLPSGEPPASPEEEAERVERLRAEQRDRSLRVYSSQRQLEAARDQALSMLEGEMKLARSGYTNQLESLERLVDFAAAQDRSGRAVSSDLRERIREGRASAATEAEKIAQLELRAASIRQQFQEDVRRWRVIKGIDEPDASPVETAAEEVPSTGTAESDDSGSPDSQANHTG